MDGGSGRVLYSKNGSEALANASTTKILTCIIALENCDFRADRRGVCAGSEGAEKCIWVHRQDRNSG